MAENPTDSDEGRKFRVTIIKRIPAPEGMAGDEWYRYVIDHVSSKIEGKRSGTYSSVQRYAEEYADNLNQRAKLGYSAYAAKKQRTT